MKKIKHLLRYDWPLHFVLLLTNWLPDNVIFLRLRGALAKPFFGKCGSDLRLARDVSFHNPSVIHLGSHVYIARGCCFISLATIELGDEVLFGPYVVVSSGNHSALQGSFRYGPHEAVPVFIGAGTWIGAHVTINAGATIGKGSLVASNASVTRKDFPLNSFIAGVPAQVISKMDEHGQ